MADGSTIMIDADMPTFGFNPCNTIFNFYPVSEDDGQYLPGGEFTIDRRTVGQLEGLILAPRGIVPCTLLEAKTLISKCVIRSYS